MYLLYYHIVIVCNKYLIWTNKSTNHRKQKYPPNSSQLSVEVRLKIIANLIVDRILEKQLVKQVKEHDTEPVQQQQLQQSEYLR